MPRGVKRSVVILCLTLELDGMGGQGHAPAALPQEKINDTHCAGGSMCPRAGLNGCGNSRLPPIGN